MRLSQVAHTIKSANAGASLVTFDIVYRDTATFERMAQAEIPSRAQVAELYRVPSESVEVYHYAPANTTKITIPRTTMFGGVDERDFDGVQQFVLLLDVEVPDELVQTP